MAEALLPPAALADLRAALDGFTPDTVLELLGPVGQSAQDRGDLLGAERALAGDDGSLATLVRLFLLGLSVSQSAAQAALAPLDPAAAPALVAVADGMVRARLEVRPYAEEGGSPWWVVSDFGSDVRPGPLAGDHVLGIGAASLNLAQLTVRTPVARALDVGTGCGIQALHLARHVSAVTATDISERALAMAATTAALSLPAPPADAGSGMPWDLRAGSLLEPVAGERYDLVVANPPFVISPGLRAANGGYDYRDSGVAGDALCADLVRGLPAVLNPGGTGQLLANWAITADAPWAARVESWLTGSGCEAWVWQREIAGPSEYVSLWLRDAGEQPGTDRWRARYTAWLDWMQAAGIVAVGMGAITVWNTGRADPVVVCEDVPQPVEQPAGAAIGAWLPRQHWLRDTADAALIEARLRHADGVVRTRSDLVGAHGWTTELEQLRLSHGMRWELQTDGAIAGLVAACDGTTPLRVPLSVLAALNEVPFEAVATAALPVVRDLVRRGFLLPEGLA